MLVTSCATSQHEVKNERLLGKFGERPKITKAVERQIIDEIKMHLKDQYSAKFIVLPYAKKGTYLGVAGWVVLTEVNAKNSFGAYTGHVGFASFVHSEKGGKFAGVIASERISKESKIVPLGLKR